MQALTLPLPLSAVVKEDLRRREELVEDEERAEAGGDGGRGGGGKGSANTSGKESGNSSANASANALAEALLVLERRRTPPLLLPVLWVEVFTPAPLLLLLELLLADEGGGVMLRSPALLPAASLRAEFTLPPEL